MMSRNEEDYDCIVWGKKTSTDFEQSANPSSATPRSDEDTFTPPNRNQRRTSDGSLEQITGRILPTSSEVRKRDKKSEQEIEMIWRRLENDDPSGTILNTTTNTSSDTPLRENLGSKKTAAMVTQENRWGLVKSRRRRRERPVHPLTLTAPRKKVDADATKAKRRMSADDAFAELLEHLKTPDRTDDSTAPPPCKMLKAQSSPPEDPSANEIQAQSTDTIPSPDPFGAFPDVDFEELDRSIIMTQSSKNQANESGKEDNLQSTAVQSKSDQNLSGPSVVTNQSQASFNQNSTLGAGNANNMDPRLPGDSSLHTTPSNNSQILPGSRPTKIEAIAFKSDTESSIKDRHDVEDTDPFGEFPMIDLAEIDKNIAKVQDAKSRTDHPVVDSTKEADLFGDFPDIDLDALDDQIATATEALPPETGLSRYRVVSVSTDAIRFTKTVHVARWKDEMFSEFEDRLAIHRESGAPYPKPKKWTVDGLIYLLGEWFYTEVEEGDFLHIYSLFGRSNTSCLPVTLDGNTQNDDLVLIMHPETLLVPTTITETLKCTRRAVLKNRLGSSGTNQALLFGTLRHKLFEETLRSLDCSPKAMKDRIEALVRNAGMDIAGCPGTTSNAARTELFKVAPQIRIFLDQYTIFGKNSSPQLAGLESNYGQSTLFRATGVDAIEEMINSPEMGLKGNIDVVVKAKTARNPFEKQEEGLVCVELKTGHNQNTDSSHMAQLALYNIMLRSQYFTSNDSVAGHDSYASENSVLLYMNDKSIKATSVIPSIKDIKTLIGQRNLVAVKQKQISDLRGVELQFEKDSEWPKVKLLTPQPARLPSIENQSMCERCYMARECSLYTALEGGSHGNASVIRQYTGHLSKVELEYFAKWDRLIDFELSASVRPIAMKWLRPSHDQEATTGKTVSSLVIKQTTSIPADDICQENFVAVTLERLPTSRQQTPLSSVGLAVGAHAIISVDETTVERTKRLLFHPRMHLARGIVSEASESALRVRVSESDFQRLQRVIKSMKEHEIPIFRLDRDDVATGIGTLRKNIINLLTGDKVLEKDVVDTSAVKTIQKLRESIVNLREPVYDATPRHILLRPPKSNARTPMPPGIDTMQMAKEFYALNSDQQRAIEKAVTARDYALIQGLPGTGKTSTISFIVRLLVAHGKRVLVTSYTHSAVDNVLLKLTKTGIAEKQNDGARSILRIGDPSRCHPGVHNLLLTTVAKEVESGKSNDYASAERIRHCVRKARVVGVTALTIPTCSLLSGEKFDVVIVDEAGQISQPAIVGALMAADAFVLVGDHMQLPPLVISELAETGGFGVSMLKRLAEAHPKHVVQLTYQYRMAEEICKMANDIVYGGVLKCANDRVRQRRLELPGFPENTPPACGYIMKAIDPSKAVVFIDTDQCKPDGDIIQLESSSDKTEGGSLVNNTEANIVEKITAYFLDNTQVGAQSIGIVSPFNAQIRLLESSSQITCWKRQGLECSTIDRYQGRDKPIIIISFVRSNVKGKVGRLLSDVRRLNVAVSRAECKLIMIGSLSTLRAGSNVLRSSFDRLKAANSIIPLST